MQNKETVRAMEAYELGAMFVFTVTSGFVTMLMAWVIVALSIKGWAVKREERMMRSSSCSA